MLSSLSSLTDKFNVTYQRNCSTFLKFFVLVLMVIKTFSALAYSCREPAPEIKSEPAAPTRKINAEEETEIKKNIIPRNAFSTLTQIGKLSLESEEKSQVLSKANPTAVTIDIDPEKHYQEIWGFGGTITQSCLQNMKALSSTQRTELIEKLFSREKGAGFSYLRVPIGANDYSVNNYTLADTPKDKNGNYIKDPKLKYFDIKKDKAFIDFVKEVRKINPDIQLMISPWSPPAWMKENQELPGGIVKPEAYEAYAKYIFKTLDAYKKAGIGFQHLSIMNEPLIGWAKEKWGFTQAYMETEEQKKFIMNNFAPLLKARPDIKTKLLVLDHNLDMTEQVKNLIQEPSIKAISAGVAFHCYGGNISMLKQFVDENPGVRVMQTECTGSFSTNPTGNDFRWWLENQSIDAVRYGATGALGWNFCLDQKGEPRNNGCWGCRGMVTVDQSKPKEPKVIYNEEYFALAQTSKYLKKGAIRIASTDTKDNGIVNVAFLNPDGSRVVVMRNTKNVDIKVSVRDDNCEAVTNVLPPNGALSLKWQAPNLPGPNISDRNKGSRKPANR